MDIVTTVGGVDKLVPKFEASEGRYVCYWPIPWNAAPGRYIVEAQVEMEKPQQWEWIAPGQRKKKRGRGQEEGPAQEEKRQGPGRGRRAGRRGAGVLRGEGAVRRGGAAEAKDRAGHVRGDVGA